MCTLEYHLSSAPQILTHILGGKPVGTGVQPSYETARKQNQGPFSTTAFRSSSWSAFALSCLEKAPFPSYL